MVNLREELFNRQLNLETEGIELGIAKVQKEIVEAKQKKGSYGDTSAGSVVIVKRKRF